MGVFSDRVYEVVARIPRGKVASYGQIARMIGQPRKSRFVGYAMRSNPNPGSDEGCIPCHRVVFKDGAICEGFAFGGPDVQRQMLLDEGVIFADDMHIDMERSQWDGYAAPSLEGVDGSMPLSPPDDFDWKAELGEED